MRILYLTVPVQDYLSDSILHGLKQIEGVTVDDFPNNNFIYKDDAAFAKNQDSLYGKGFSLYNTLQVSKRTGLIFETINYASYDLIIFSAIDHQYGLLLQMRPYLRYDNTIILDGSDSGFLVPYAGAYLKSIATFFYPRIHKQYRYFKREIIKETIANLYYKLLPEFLFGKQLPKNVKQISFSIPEEKIVKSKPEKLKLFPKHIVDKEVLAQTAGSFEKYAFSDEAEYYKDLQMSRFGITTKRSGWDCMRHYEIAANGAIICFRDLHNKPPQCAPHGLEPGVNCISYKSYQDLMKQIDDLGDVKYLKMQEASLVWVKASTTIAKAKKMLEDFKLG